MATPEQDPQQPGRIITPDEFSAQQVASPSRRRFGRAGAAAAAGGVLATLKSQPGMACTICVTPSGYQSFKTGSPNPRAANKCQGIPPSEWIKSTCAWPSGMNRNTFKFKNAFTYTTGVSATGNTLLSLMQASGNASNTAWMMKYLAANYLNMRSGRMPFLTMEILNGIWTGWCLNQSYTPSAGARVWYFAELREYLSGTV